MIKEETTDCIKKALETGISWVSLRIVLGTCLNIFIKDLCIGISHSDFSQWRAESEKEEEGLDGI